MLAERYPDDRERGNAMGIALGGSLRQSVCIHLRILVYNVIDNQQFTYRRFVR
jgi:hypothetical protein